MNTKLEPNAVGPNDAAQYIGMSRSWLAQARMRGEGPPFMKIGRSVRYLISDLDSWLEERRRACRAKGAA